MIRRLAEHTWAASRKESRIARTVVLKLKTSDFKILTRSHTPTSPPSSCEELTTIARSLRGRVGLDSQQRFRLVGVGLSNFRERMTSPPSPRSLSRSVPDICGNHWTVFRVCLSCRPQVELPGLGRKILSKAVMLFFAYDLEPYLFVDVSRCVKNALRP